MTLIQFGPKSAIYYDQTGVYGLRCPSGDWVAEEVGDLLPEFTLCDAYHLRYVLMDFLITAQEQKVPWCGTLEDFLEAQGYL